MDTTKVLTFVSSVVLVVAAFTVMVFAWRARRRRSGAIARPTLTAAELGAERADVEAFYVATTPFEKPLERLALTGLEFRARARIRIFDSGLVIEVPGESPTLVPASSITAVGRTNVTIDRVVESDGLIVLSWLADPATSTVVDSYFRIVDRATREQTVAAISAVFEGSALPASAPATDPEN